MPTIRSLQNERIKAAVKLRDRRGRDRQGRIIIDGLREVQHALAAEVGITEVFFCPDFTDSAAASDLLGKLESTSAELTAVTMPVWEKLAFGSRRDGIVAIATPPHRQLADIDVHESALIVTLDSLEKPGNVGAIVRSADAAGADGIVVIDGGTDIYNPNTIRASIGTVFRLPVVTANGTEAISWLRKHELAVYLARVGAGDRYTKPDYRPRCAIVVGSEAAGLDDKWNQPGFHAIHLPMHGAADSLNVAVTTAVLLYEVVRQRL